MAAVLVLQAVFAGIGIAGTQDGLGPLVAGSPLQILVLLGFVAYVLAVAAFAVGVVVEAAWLRPLGMGAAIAGIALAMLRLGTGEALDGLLFGMGIDALILYGLRRPDIRALFPA